MPGGVGDHAEADETAEMNETRRAHALTVEARKVVFDGQPGRYKVKSQQENAGADQVYSVFVEGHTFHTHTCSCPDFTEHSWRAAAYTFGCKHIWAARRHGVQEQA